MVASSTLTVAVVKMLKCAKKKNKKLLIMGDAEMQQQMKQLYENDQLKHHKDF
jgi:hypothetical protein